MPDFSQRGPITTLHDLGLTDSATLESMLRKADLEALSRKGMRDFVDGMSTTTNALGLAVLGEYFE